MTKLSVAVCGGGVGGMTLAIALQVQGHAVQVFEQTQAYGRVGADVNLTPNAVHALDRLGVEFRQQFPVGAFRHLAAFLFRGGLFRGNSEDYYHPDRSNLAAVLRQRVGNPVSLCCLFVLVGSRRALQRAIANDRQANRFTSLAERLQVAPPPGATAADA